MRRRGFLKGLLFVGIAVCSAWTLAGCSQAENPNVGQVYELTDGWKLTLPAGWRTETHGDVEEAGEPYPIVLIDQAGEQRAFVLVESRSFLESDLRRVKKLMRDGEFKDGRHFSGALWGSKFDMTVTSGGGESGSTIADVYIWTGERSLHVELTSSRAMDRVIAAGLPAPQVVATGLNEIGLRGP